MTSEQYKDFMRRFLASSVDEDVAAFRAMLSPELVAHVLGGAVNREVFLQHNNVFNLAFSDRQFTAEDLTTEGDVVVARATWRGTHTGDFQGLPPTGKQVVINAFVMERLKEGKSVEHWSLFDRFTMMQQLGLIPPPQAAR